MFGELPAVTVVFALVAELIHVMFFVGGGFGMVLLAMGSMLGVAIVLLITKPALLRGVQIQGIALLNSANRALRPNPGGGTAGCHHCPATTG